MHERSLQLPWIPIILHPSQACVRRDLGRGRNGDRLQWVDGDGEGGGIESMAEELREVASAVTTSPRFVVQYSTVMDVTRIVRSRYLFAHLLYDSLQFPLFARIRAHVLHSVLGVPARPVDE